MRSIGLIFCLFGLLLSCNTKKEVSVSVSELHLSNKSASHSAKELYKNLDAYAQKGYLVGHQDAVAYGIGWKDQGFQSDVYKVTGEYPSVFGWDLGHIHDTVNIDSVPFRRMNEWAKEIDSRGGINTYGWHSLNFETGDSSWDKTSCVSSILSEGEHHAAFLSKLDMLADFFKSLKKDDGSLMPVLFRPWHEMNGSWFWWGKGNCSVEEYKQLWKFTYDYLTKKHQLNNIIWVYSTDVFETAEEYLVYYPGDEYVDVLGFDDYKGVSSKDKLHTTINRLEILSDLSKDKSKLFVLSETGSEKIPHEKWFTEFVDPIMMANEKTKGAAYVLFWRNGRPDHFYVPYNGHPAEADFVAFEKLPNTLFLSDVQEINNTLKQ